MDLKWVPARNADSHLIYFGKSGQLQFKKSQKEYIFSIGPLAPHTKYVWRIDEVAGSDTLRGSLWHFTTE